MRSALFLIKKTSMPLNHLRFGSQPNTCHSHGNAFPRKRRIDFSHRRIDKWQVFGWYWRNSEHCSQQLKFQPIWPPPQRGRWAWGLGLYLKNCAIPRQAFYINLSASRCGRSHSGHWLFEKIQSHCFSRNQPNTVCLFSSGPAHHFFYFSGPACPPNIFSGLVRFTFFI